MAYVNLYFFQSQNVQAAVETRENFHSSVHAQKSKETRTAMKKEDTIERMDSRREKLEKNKLYREL